MLKCALGPAVDFDSLDTVGTALNLFHSFSSMSRSFSASPAKKAKTSVTWSVLPATVIDGSVTVTLGQQVGVCNTCTDPVTIRETTKLGWSLGRQLAQCPLYECKSFKFFSGPTHTPSNWPDCECGSKASYREDNGRHVFKCWKKEAGGTGCMFRKQVQTLPDLEHHTCILPECGLDQVIEASMSQLSNQSASSMPSFGLLAPMALNLPMPMPMPTVRAQAAAALSVYQSTTGYMIFALSTAEFEVEDYAVGVTVASPGPVIGVVMRNDFGLGEASSAYVQLKERVDVELPPRRLSPALRV
jgi:hypothetical protein